MTRLPVCFWYSLGSWWEFPQGRFRGSHKSLGAQIDDEARPKRTPINTTICQPRKLPSQVRQYVAQIAANRKSLRKTGAGARNSK